MVTVKATKSGADATLKDADTYRLTASISEADAKNYNVNDETSTKDYVINQIEIEVTGGITVDETNEFGSDKAVVGHAVELDTSNATFSGLTVADQTNGLDKDHKITVTATGKYTDVKVNDGSDPSKTNVEITVSNATSKNYKLKANNGGTEEAPNKLMAVGVITKASLAPATLSDTKTYTYNAEKQTITPTVTINGKVVPDEEYSYLYYSKRTGTGTNDDPYVYTDATDADLTNAGTVYVKAISKNVSYLEGSTTAADLAITIDAMSISNANADAKAAVVTAVGDNGTVSQVLLTVYKNSEKTAENVLEEVSLDASQYTIINSTMTNQDTTNGTKTYSATVQLNDGGNYSGTVSIEYTIATGDFGDVKKDGTLTTSDVVDTLYISAGLTSSDGEGDTNSDGTKEWSEAQVSRANVVVNSDSATEVDNQITSTDALYIMQNLGNEPLNDVLDRKPTPASGT